MKQERARFEKKEAPFNKIGSSSMETSEQTKCEMEGGEPEMNIVNISKILVTLPSYLGHDDPSFEIFPLSVSSELPHYESLDSMAQRVMHQTFNVPMNLDDIKSFKPQLWYRLLEKIDVKNHMTIEVPQSKELCKVSTYAKVEGKKGNTTLKIKKDTHQHLAILDTGAGVSIITKET